MYGADVISVLNKAIDNNERNNATLDNKNKHLYVNVIIKITQKDIGERVETYTRQANGTYKLTSNVLKSGRSVFKKDTEYILSNADNKEMFEKLLINKMTWTDATTGQTYNAKDSSVSTYSEGCTSYTITYYPAAEFKRTTFRCTDIQYSEMTGRVVSMTFEQFK